MRIIEGTLSYGASLSFTSVGFLLAVSPLSQWHKVAVVSVIACIYSFIINKKKKTTHK